MPDEQTWDSFFDPRRVLRQLAFADDTGDVIDLGCGYGTFAVAAAQLTRGTVHAFDIDPQMVAATADNARRLNLHNVRAIERDVLAAGTGLSSNSVAYAMLFNILHAEDVGGLLHATGCVLHPDGVLAVVHWVHDARTPRGPPLAIRPRPEQCSDWLRAAGFVPEPPVALPPYHFGLVARRSGTVR